MSDLPQEDEYFVPHTDNQQVVLDYLESLLEDPAAIALSTEAELEAIGLARDVVGLEAQSVSDAESEVDTAASGSLAEASAETPEDISSPAQPASVSHAPTESCSAENPEELNCIIVQLQGLNLAIPVDQVEGASSMDSLTLELETAHDWILGTYSSLGQETSVVDTGQWIMPGRCDPSNARYEEVLIIKGRKWALACDTLVKSLRMSNNDIVLSRDQSARPWLLGTNMKERCAILDIAAMVQLLDAEM